MNNLEAMPCRGWPGYPLGAESFITAILSPGFSSPHFGGVSVPYGPPHERRSPVSSTPP